MINLNLSKKQFVPKHFPYVYDYSNRWECYMGSAGSSKSYFITQKIIIRACSEKIRILVARRYGTTLRNTCFSLFKEILSKWKLIPYVKVNESDMRISFPNGSEIIFMGLDDECKLLSLNNIGTVFIEEAYEVPKDMVEQLNLRMRGDVKNQQIIMAWNPISSHHWLYDFCQNPPDSFVLHRSTYKDNPFLPEEYVNSLEELYTRNPQKARIFCDGEWGIDVDGLVITNWEVADFDEVELAKTLNHKCGADLGWLDPSAVVSSLYDEQNKIIYVCDEFYKTGQTLDDLYNAIVGMNLSKSKIQFDSAEPRSIDFFKRKGIHAVPCVKGQNSVQARIAFLQNHKIIVKPKCENMIMNLSNFSYEKDKRTGKFMEDKYTHEFSHGIDALGYAYSDIYTRSKLRTLDKSILGL